MRKKFKPFEQAMVFHLHKLKPEDKINYPEWADKIFVSCSIGADGPDWYLLADSATPFALREMADDIERDLAIKKTHPSKLEEPI